MKNNNCNNDILNCSITDSSGLNDYQKSPSMTNIEIPKVGIERFRLPINYKYFNGEVKGHDALASMYINLAAHKTGVNMSRFCSILQEEVINSFDNDVMSNIVDRFTKELRDSDQEKEIEKVEVKLEFSICLKQKSLVSDNWGFQYYPTILIARLINGKKFLNTTIKYEYSSTCPCSLSMAKQYEQDFKDGVTIDGNGIATAHGQRSLATVEIMTSLGNDLSLENTPEFLISIINKAIPTETQSLVKRADEQAFAILNGSNPIFVEHAIRNIDMALEKESSIIDWNAKVEHFESLHSHNAVAYSHKKKSEV